MSAYGVEGEASSMQNTDILPWVINDELCNVYTRESVWIHRF